MKSSMTFIQSNECTGIDWILKEIWRRFIWWQVSFNTRHTQFHLVGFENSQTPSTTTVWPSDHRDDYRSCAWPLYRPFLKHCTLTNKAVGTLWRALSKPPQRRQGPDLRPLWLLVGTPSAIRTELAFSRAEHSLPYSDVTIFIFAISYLSSMLYVYRFLWPLRLRWLLVWYKEVYLQILNVCPFDYTAVAGSGTVGPVNHVNHTSWVAVVTPTDRPKSVRNRCLIELFCSVVYVVNLPFWHFRWCRDFCHRTESDLLLFVFGNYSFFNSGISNEFPLTPLLIFKQFGFCKRYFSYICDGTYVQTDRRSCTYGRVPNAIDVPVDQVWGYTKTREEIPLRNRRRWSGWQSPLRRVIFFGRQTACPLTAKHRRQNFHAFS